MAAQSRDDRWDQGDLHEGYGSLPGDLIERGHRVVCAEDRESNLPARSVAERITRDARKAQLIAARRQASRAEDKQRHVRETLAARQPKTAQATERAARAASPRGRESR